ncbi:hypothetical protein BDY21DRAFT_372822 [Lineolata rhizophorae]|uniref:Cyclin-dependent kinase n=1 Tax=Lineolata rhizophorae TaxID=578093 RepID=A0A6A6NWS9_9PEZI|nr:hypothetical protein BDY21DRAFT_372822 [Lineolata rhizophorae]
MAQVHPPLLRLRHDVDLLPPDPTMPAGEARPQRDHDHLAPANPPSMSTAASAITTSTTTTTTRPPKPSAPDPSAPESQGSNESAASAAHARLPRLLSTSSNLSNSTGPDTAVTSPSSSNGAAQLPLPSQDLDPHRQNFARHPRRPVTPSIQTDLGEAGRSGDASALTSPMALDTPSLVPASKRTASGTVKQTMLSSAPSRSPAVGHSRTTSLDSSTSKIGELSANLKTRLSYAMVKVQNGWENHSLHELEDAAASSPARASGSTALAASTPLSRMSRGPNISPSSSCPGTGERPAVDGVGTATRRRLSAYCEASDRYIISPSTQSSPTRHSYHAGISTPNVGGRDSPSSDGLSNTTYPPFWSFQPAPSTVAESGASSGPSLAPAPEIVPRPHARDRRTPANRVPPLLSGSRLPPSGSVPSSLAQHSPMTPTASSPSGSGSAFAGGAPQRAGILRMPSQQAEKDAVDTLLFMSSPNNSGRMGNPHVGVGNVVGASPTTLGKRVVFEGEGMGLGGESR